MNQAELNNEKSGILWEMRQRYFCVSYKMQQVLLVPKYPK